jgi:hypothetical protein
MLEKVKDKLNNSKDESKKRKEERTRAALEKKEERARIDGEKAEEEARIEREKIQAEKDALMALSEKELVVEAIMALRGYNTRLDNIEEHQEYLKERIDSLDSNLSSLDYSIYELKNN